MLGNWNESSDVKFRNHLVGLSGSYTEQQAVLEAWRCKFDSPCSLYILLRCTLPAGFPSQLLLGTSFLFSILISNVFVP